MSDTQQRTWWRRVWRCWFLSMHRFPAVPLHELFDSRCLECGKGYMEIFWR